MHAKSSMRGRARNVGGNARRVEAARRDRQASESYLGFPLEGMGQVPGESSPQLCNELQHQARAPVRASLGSELLGKWPVCDSVSLSVSLSHMHTHTEHTHTISAKTR